MTDPFGREINYLRVSLTDRCNFRCVYCMPEEGAPFLPKEHILNSEELKRLIRIAHEIGFIKIRFTGGEPLIRTDILDILSETSKLQNINDISLTTNGQLLGNLAVDLKHAGLDRVNISLDTLDPNQFRKIARGGDLQSVLKGIEAASEAGLNPIKINCVLLKGENDMEVCSFAELTKRFPYNIRFIELMPIQWNTDASKENMDWKWHGKQGLLKVISHSEGRAISGTRLDPMFFSVANARSRIEDQFGPLEPVDIQTNGPAQNFKIRGHLGTVGFISQITNDFCAQCNRIRLTADGFLRPCLMSDGELDIKTPMRGGASDGELTELFRHVIDHKPERHYLAEGQAPVSRFMSQIGG